MEVFIEYKGQRLAVDSLGGGIKSYYVHKDGERRDIIYGYRDIEAKDGCMGDVLSPFPGRMVDDEYEWQGTKYVIAEELKLNGRALHAFVDQFEWRVEKISDSMIQATFQTEQRFNDKGFPFNLEYKVEYSIGEEGLTVKTNVKNVGRTTAPFGIGYHPYFAVTEVVDVAEWQVPAKKVVEFDENLKPTGRFLSTGEASLDFREFSVIGDKIIDNCFFELERDSQGIFNSVLKNNKTGEKITIWQDEAYPYFQTYSSDTIKPEHHRKAMALEPQSCCGFAINMPELGLIALKSGEEFKGSWGVKVK